MQTCLTLPGIWEKSREREQMFAFLHPQPRHDYNHNKEERVHDKWQRVEVDQSCLFSDKCKQQTNTLADSRESFVTKYKVWTGNKIPINMTTTPESGVKHAKTLSEDFNSTQSISTMIYRDAKNFFVALVPTTWMHFFLGEISSINYLVERSIKPVSKSALNIISEFGLIEVVCEFFC